MRRFQPSAVKILGVEALEVFDGEAEAAVLVFLDDPTSFLKAFLNISHPHLGFSLGENGRFVKNFF